MKGGTEAPSRFRCYRGGVLRFRGRKGTKQFLQKRIFASLPKEIMPVTFGPNKREGTGFGLGFSVKIAHADWNRHDRLGEYGWGGMASTHYWVSPRDHLVVVTMEQTLPFDFLLEDQLKPLIYDAIVE